MEAFSKMLCQRDYDREHINEIIEELKSSFIDCEELNEKNLKDLEFLEIVDGDSALFKFHDSCNVYKYCICDPTWSVLYNRNRLMVGVKSPLEGVRLLKKSSKNIEYILYPFEQADEYDLKYLSLDGKKFIDLTKLSEVCNCHSEQNCTIKWSNELTLEIDGTSSTYTVLLNGEFLSGFSDEESYFQSGDNCTKSYLYKNNLIVHQCGDVSSVVIIKKRNLN